MFDFSNYSTKSKCYDNSNKLLIGKFKDETGGVAVEECIGLKPKMQKNARGVNKNVFTTISYNEYKDVLLNNTFIRHSRNGIQSKCHRTGTYEINKISLPCFDDKTYIQSNGYDVISSWLLDL